MNSIHFDPDLKVNMSLDEIIKLTKPELDSQLNKKILKRVKTRNNRRKKKNLSLDNHSVPLQPLGGGVVYVSKSSPLLSEENKRRIVSAVSNRILNSELLDKTKEIIPANYKLIKTNSGIERVLVPAEDHMTNYRRNLNGSSFSNITKFQTSNEKPPPLIETPICSGPSTSSIPVKMEIDEESEDEVVVLDTVSKNSKTKPEVIDVEADSKVNEIGSKFPIIVPQQSVGKTLHDRFTMLCGNLQF